MDDHKAKARGQQAQRLIEDDLLNEAFSAIQAELTAKMVSAKTDEGTLKGKELIGLLNDVRSYLHRVLKDGTVAAKTIELEEQRKKSWFGRDAA